MQPSPRTRGEGTAMRVAFAAQFSRTTLRSRESQGLPRFAVVPLMKEGAERRQALGACEAPFCVRTNDGPRVPAQIAHAVRAPGDARLSALHCGGLLASGTARVLTFLIVALRAPRVRS